MTFTRTLSRTIVFTSILFSSISIFGMEEEPLTYMSAQSVGFASDSDDDNAAQAEDNEALEFGDLNDKFDKILFEESYARVPADIKRIVDRSLATDELKLSLKIFALVGPTGSGKSIAARAIAAKMGREYIFVSSLNLLGSVLHKGLENVRALFKGLRKFKKLPVLILDEANYLGDDYIKGNSDAKFTVSKFWSKLDLLEEREDFFMIVTGNKFSELPPQLQDRLMMHFYELPYLPSTSERIKSAIQKYPGYSEAQDCDKNFFDGFAQRSESLSARVINSMVEFAIGLAWERKSKLVTAKDLNDACDRAFFNRQNYCDFTPHMAPEERRHQEMKDLQRESLAQAQKHQEINHEFNQLNGLCNAIAQDKAAAVSSASSLPVVGSALGGLIQAGTKSNAETYVAAINAHQQRLQQSQFVRLQAQRAQQPQQVQRAQQIANFPIPIQGIMQDVQEIGELTRELSNKSTTLRQQTQAEKQTNEALINSHAIHQQALLLQQKLQQALTRVYEMQQPQAQKTRLDPEVLACLKYIDQQLLVLTVPILNVTLQASVTYLEVQRLHQQTDAQQQSTPPAQQAIGIPPKDKEEAYPDSEQQAQPQPQQPVTQPQQSAPAPAKPQEASSTCVIA